MAYPGRGLSSVVLSGVNPRQNFGLSVTISSQALIFIWPSCKVSILRILSSHSLWSKVVPSLASRAHNSTEINCFAISKFFVMDSVFLCMLVDGAKGWKELTSSSKYRLPFSSNSKDKHQIWAMVIFVERPAVYHFP